MEIKFHPHAVERMLERKISVAEIELIITQPDGKIQQSKDKAIMYKAIPKRKDNLVAAVVVEIFSRNLFEIITVLVNFEVRK